MNKPDGTHPVPIDKQSKQTTGNGTIRDNRMKVAVIFDNFGPYHVARLTAAARILSVTGIELGANSADYAWQPPERGGFHHVTLFPGTASAQPKSVLAAAMEAQLTVLSPDAVAIPGWADSGGLAALRWGIRHKTPVIVMSESNQGDHDRNRFREAVKRQIVGLCGAGLAGGSKAAAYLSALGMPTERIFVGYDAIDNTYFADGAAAAKVDGAATRARLGLPGRYFLTCCRLIDKKNIAFLINCFATYRQGVADDQAWDLVIAGDGPLRPELQALAGRLGVAASVHFPGFIQYQALPDYYGMAGAFVLPSMTEQWGLVVNEAMAAGLPVLVSDRCGCAPDLVVDGDNGFSFDPTDPTALVTAMTQLAHQSDLAAMGAESRRIIAKVDTTAFADGLANAVSVAIGRPAMRASFPARLLLEGMLA